MRINITIPDDVHAEIKALTETGQAGSVSGFITDAVRRSLAYARDAVTMNELFGPPSPDEQSLIDQMRNARPGNHPERGVIIGHVLDASAVLDLATGKTIYVRARVRAAIAEQATLVVPAAALARAWQLAPDHGRPVLERLPHMEVIHIDDLDDVIAQQTGLLTTHTPDLTIDAAQAAWSARWRHWPLITAHPDHYTGLGLRIEPLP